MGNESLLCGSLFSRILQARPSIATLRDKPSYFSQKKELTIIKQDLVKVMSHRFRKTDLEAVEMKLTFINLEPAFDGVEGWITITELAVIDPITPTNKLRFLTMQEVTAPDGTIFVYAYPQERAA